MTSTRLSARSARRRYLALLGLRWLPVGLTIPVAVLLLTERGLSLGQVGLVTAVQGVVVMLLELPTGGLADAIGRRPVLLVATLVDAAALLVFLGASSVAVLLGVYAAKGLSRALDSGPLDAWYVDAVLADDDGADIETALAHGTAVLCAAIAAGGVVAGGLVALGGGSGSGPLLAPVLAAVVIDLVAAAAIARWMVEPHRTRTPGALAGEVRAVPATIRAALGTVARSRALKALVAVEALWCFGMAAFEILMAPRLADLLGSTDEASAVQGPVVAVAWTVSALAAAGVPRLVRRVGAPVSGAVLRVGQGLSVLAMAVALGPVALVAAYVVTYGIHGASNPVHSALLHRNVDGAARVTVVSVNSMLGMPAAAVGGVVLGWTADAAGIPAAMAVGALVLASAAPLYLLARPQQPAVVPAEARALAA